MSESYIIGIDIGGTNTDIVLVDQTQKIIRAFKTETTSPLEIGVRKGLTAILHNPLIDKSAVMGVFVGTTHATNAIVEQKNLYSVGLIRIAGHQPMSLRPCFGWPNNLFSTIFIGYETIDGGFECDLRHLSKFSKRKAKDAFSRLLDKGMESLAVIGVFSPLSFEHELACSEAIMETVGRYFPISLSHEIGGIGFIERENATILNAALKKPMKEGFSNLEIVKMECGLKCPLYITQNDGSLIDLADAIKNPLLTISSGPTNSFVGASKLAQVSEAIIVDIGGTTTDIGVIRNGVLRRSMHNIAIGGISLNFRMPDVMSMGIGGGSYITPLQNGQFKIGPESCGKKLITEALSFGGKSLTLTDIALNSGMFQLEGSCPIDFSDADAKSIMQQIDEKIQNGIKLMKGKNNSIPVLYVGGAAKIASPASENDLEYYSVANAFGAALAGFSATVDRVVSLNERSQTIHELKNQAIELAIKKGADPNHVNINDIQIIPYHYIPNQLARVIITASGKRKS